MRMTHASVAVAAALMRRPTERHWGYDLHKEAKVKSGVLYPMLRRWHAEGLLADGWEDPADIIDSRPPRRYYTLTERGRRELGTMLVNAAADERFDLPAGTVLA